MTMRICIAGILAMMTGLPMTQAGLFSNAPAEITLEPGVAFNLATPFTQTESGSPLAIKKTSTLSPSTSDVLESIVFGYGVLDGSSFSTDMLFTMTVSGNGPAFVQAGATVRYTFTLTEAHRIRMFADGNINTNSTANPLVDLTAVYLRDADDNTLYSIQEHNGIVSGNLEFVLPAGTYKYLQISSLGYNIPSASYDIRNMVLLSVEVADLGVAAIPEPGTCALLLPIVTVMLARRRLRGSL